MRHGVGPVVLGVLLGLGLAATALPAVSAGAPVVTIDVSTQADGSLLVAYTAPPGIDELAFVDTHLRTHRLFREPMLRPVDDCAIVAEGVIRRARPQCAALRFAVTPRRLGAAAFYEPAQPATDGVLLHTRHYAVTAPGLGLVWQFRARPGQEVVLAGRASEQQRAQLGAADVAAALADPDRGRRLEQLLADHFVFIGRAETRTHPDFVLLRDAAVPRWLADHVERTAGAALHGFAQGFDAAPRARVTLILLADGQSGVAGGRFGYHGDVSRGPTIRLHFVAPAPAEDTNQMLQADEFVAHELAHLWNSDRFRSDPDRPWLHEGGAEWLAAVLLHQLLRVPAYRLGERLQASFETCVLTNGNEPWARLGGGHGIDRAYACGMVLHALAYAAVRQHDPALTPLAASAALYRQAAVLDEEGFARFADRGTPAGRALRRLLFDADVVLVDALVDVLAALGVPHRVVPVAGLTRLAPHVRVSLVRAIGGGDCARFAGFWTRADYIEFDPDNECRTLPTAARLTSVAGVSLLHDPGRAVEAVAAHCATARSVAIGLHDGQRVEVPCPRLTTPAMLVQVEAAAFHAVLLPTP